MITRNVEGICLEIMLTLLGWALRLDTEEDNSADDTLPLPLAPSATESRKP